MLLWQLSRSPWALLTCLDTDLGQLAPTPTASLACVSILVQACFDGWLPHNYFCLHYLPEGNGRLWQLILNSQL